MKKNNKIRITICATALLVATSLAVFGGLSLKETSAANTETEYVLDVSGAPNETLRFAEAIGNNMLYQQGEPITVWGFAPAESSISLTLTPQNDAQAIDATIQEITVKADENGYFEGAFEGKEASYTEYKILATDGVTDISAEHILFGELFLSCGQSNMAFNVQYSSNADEIMNNANNPNIRVFMSPEISGSAALPYRPVAYYPGGVWVRGDSAMMIGGASAVTYNFALELFEKLNQNGAEVPVGFLNTAKGATSIEAWLSRPSVDSNNDVRAYLEARNRLLDEEDYNKAGSNNYNQVSAMFNSKIAPLSNLYIAGILWYQGENNVGNEIAGQYYKNALSLLMKDWSRWFNDGESDIPFVFAQITPHNYGYEPEALAYMWEGMSEAYESNSEQASMVTTYDIPLDWYNKAFSYRSPIHPMVKKPVGERMAAFIFNRLYGGEGAKSSPVFESITFKGNTATVSFKNVKGLKTTNGLDVVGLALCGENRIFYPAEAHINADGTLSVSSVWVKEPVAVTYGFSTMISSANLCSDEGYPVAPFRSDKVISTYYHPKDWQNCDSLQYFVSRGSGTEESLALDCDAYSASATATLSISETGDYGNAVKINYTLRGRETFWFSPILGYNGVFEQFSLYDTMMFKIRNTQSRKIDIDSVKVTLSDGRSGELFLVNGEENTAHSAIVNGETEEYQVFVFSLNTLITENGETDISSIRALITDIRIYFKDYISGSIEIDSFSFGNLTDLAVDLKDEGSDSSDKGSDNSGNIDIGDLPISGSDSVDLDSERSGCSSSVTLLPMIGGVLPILVFVKKKTKKK